MPFVPCPEVSEVVINYRFDAEDCVTVIHIHDDDPDIFTDPTYHTGLAQDVWNQWDDHVMPWLSANVSMVSVVSTDISVENGRHGGYASAAVLGGQTGQSLPANVSLVVAKLSAFSGRNANGRMLLPGVTEGNWPGGANSSLPGTFVSNVNTAIANVITGVEDGLRAPLDQQRHLVVCSRFDGTSLQLQSNGETRRVPTPRAEGVTFDVQALVLSPKVGTIRRRLSR